MSVNALAPELLRLIFAHLDDCTDLGNASLVCRSWFPHSREINWRRFTLTFDVSHVARFASVLRENENTAIPRRIEGAIIDGRVFLECPDDERMTAWREDLSVVLNHFSPASKLTLRNLDLTKFSLAIEQFLQFSMDVTTLIFQDLTVERAYDVLSFILKSPRVEHLDLGACCFVDKKDKAADLLTLPAHSSDSPRLRQLAISGACETLLSPLLDFPQLSYLKTLLVPCNGNGVISTYVNATSPYLHALGIRFFSSSSDGRNMAFDLSCARSLRKLGIDLSGLEAEWGWCEPLPMHFIQTLLSVPRLEHLFINCGIMLYARFGNSDAEAWETLDYHLVRLPCLKSVTFTVDYSHIEAKYTGGHYQRQYNLRSRNFALVGRSKRQLAACYEKNLIRIGHIGSWTTQPFGDNKTIRSWSLVKFEKDELSRRMGMPPIECE